LKLSVIDNDDDDDDAHSDGSYTYLPSWQYSDADPQNRGVKCRWVG